MKTSRHKLIQYLGIWFLFIGIVFGSHANELDSLYKIAYSAKDRVGRVDAYISYLTKLSRSDHDSVLFLSDSAIALYRMEKDTYALARMLSAKSWYLMYKARYEESINLCHEAILLQKSIHDTFGLAMTLNRIGLSSMKFGRKNDAWRYVKLAYYYFNSIHDSSKIDMVVNNFGVMHANEGNYKEAIRCYKVSIAIREAQHKPYWVAYGLYNIGDTYLRDGMFDSAQHYFLKACDIFLHQTEQATIPPMVNLGTGDCYFQKGDFKTALIYTQAGTKDAEIQGHTELLIIGKKQLAEIQFALGNYKEAYLTNEAYLALKEESDSANNAANVAEAEARYQNAEHEAHITELENKRLEGENKLQQFRFWSVIATSILLAFITFGLFLFQRRKQTERIAKEQLNTRIAEARMFALRAQMNPHFIFNAINTAQHFVMNNQREQAYEYLSNFAKLLRLVMNNSSKTYVPLEDELSQIELYINLESIRFENKFKYSIDVDPALKNGVFEIPAMVIQPLVENAIGHGLINRGDQHGELNISFQLDGDDILCNISDNGVGRIKAAEIKSQKSMRYTSAAIPNINERLSLLKRETARGVDLNMEDLYPNASFTGTKVILRLPHK